MADQFYIEEGYIDSSYFVYTADASANIAATCDLVADVGVIKNADSVITSDSLVIADVFRFREYSANLISEFTISDNGYEKIVNAIVILEDVFNTTLTADAFKNHTAILETFADLIAIPTRTRSVSATLAAESTVFALTSETVNSSADLVSEFTVTTTGLRIQNTNATFVAEAIVTLAANLIADSVSVQITEFSAQATANTIKSTPADLASVSQIDQVFIDRIRDLAATLNSEIQLSADNSRIRSSSVAIQDAFQSQLTADAFKNHTAILDTFTDLIATANRSRDTNVVLENILNLNAQAGIISQAQSALAAESNLSAEAFNVQFADSAMSSEFALSANGIEFVLRANPFSRPIDLNSPPYTFSTDSIEGSHSLEIASGFAEYTENTNSFRFEDGEDFYIYFRFKFTGQFTYYPARILSYGNPDQAGVRGWSINFTSARTIEFRFWNGSQVVSVSRTNATDYAANTWLTPIRIVRSNGVITVNGGGNTTYTGAIAPPLSNVFIAFENPTDAAARFDDFKILRGTADLNNENNDTYLVSKLLFNNTGLDTWYRTQEYAADLAATTALTASARADFLAGANPASEFIVIANSEINRSADSSLSDQFLLTAIETRIRDFDSALSTTAELAAVGTVNRNAVSDLISISELSAGVAKTVDPVVDLPAIAITLTAAAKTGNFLVDLASEFAISVAAQKTTDITSNQSALSSASADSVIIANGVSILASETVFTCDAQKTTTAISSMVSTTELLITYTKIQQGVASLASIFTGSVSGISSVSGEGVLEIIANLTADNTRLKLFTSAINTSVTVSVVGEKTASAILNSASESQLTIQPSRTRSTGADLPAVLISVAVAAMIGDFFVNAEVNSTLTAVAAKTVDSLTGINASAETVTLPNRIRNSAVGIGVDADLAVTPTIATVAVADLVALSAAVIQPIKTVTANAALALEFNLTASSIANKTIDAELAVDCGFAATAITVSQGSSSISATATIAVNAGISVSADANLPAITALLTVVRSIQSSRVVYVVPRESRTHTVGVESRSHTIARESRTHRIQGVA